MSLELVRSSIDGTSAGGAIRRRSRREPMQVGVMGIAPGTSTATVHPPLPTRTMATSLPTRAPRGSSCWSTMGSACGVPRGV